MIWRDVVHRVMCCFTNSNNNNKRRRKSIIIISAEDEQLDKKKKKEEEDRERREWDMIHMGPLEKLVTYGSPPWKLALDFLTVVLAFLLVLVIATGHKPYLAGSSRTMAGMFLPGEDEGGAVPDEGDEGAFVAYIATAQDALEHMALVAERYIGMPDTAADVYVFPHTRGSTPHMTHWYTLVHDEKSPRDIIAQHSSNGSGNGTTTTTTTTGAGRVADLGRHVPPIVFIQQATTYHSDGSGKTLADALVEHGPSVRDTMDRLVEAAIEFELASLDIASRATDIAQNSLPECHLWTVTVHYDFRVRVGSLPVRIYWKFRRCEDVKYSE